MTSSTSDFPSFETALAELERILRNLEDGATSLEESLTQYERGIALLKSCYQVLHDSEQRILKLSGVDEQGRPILEPFQHTATLEAARKPPPKPAAPRDSSY